MYILYIIVLKIKLITNLHALSVAIHVPPNTGGNLELDNERLDILHRNVAMGTQF